jgi:RNA polymerase sigma-70 factor (ECF subfamily)
LLLSGIAAESEVELITRAQQGDRNAFGEIVRRYYPQVVRVAYRVSGDAALAEDAAQEAFLRAWQHLPGIRVTSSFKSWVFRIAINAVMDVLRRKPEEELEEEGKTPIVDDAPGPEMHLVQAEQAASVQEAIRSLPEGAQSVLILREYGELSYREISTALNIPVGTVMSRLSYARGRLREILGSRSFEVEADDD